MNYTLKRGDRVKLDPTYIDHTFKNSSLDLDIANSIGKVINSYDLICSVKWSNGGYYLYKYDMLIPYEDCYIEEDGEY